MSVARENHSKENGPPRVGQILQAFLDTFSYPVWIADENGAVCMNEMAQSMVRQDASLAQTGQLVAPGETRKVTVSGKRYSLNKRDINHGTNCMLLEMHAEEDAANRLRESTKKLKRALTRN